MLKIKASVLLAAVIILCLTSCKSSGKPDDDGSKAGTGALIQTEATNTAKGYEIMFDNITYTSHDDSKLFLNYTDDGKKLYPWDDYSRPDVTPMHFFKTKYGVGIKKGADFTDKFEYSDADLIKADSSYITQWKFKVKRLGVLPELYIAHQDMHIYDKVTFEVTNLSDNTLKFSLRSAEFNPQPYTNPKSGAFSALSQTGVKPGETATIELDFKQAFASYDLLPVATTGFYIAPIGVRANTDYMVNFSDFRFCYALNPVVSGAVTKVQKEEAIKAGSLMKVAFAADNIKIADNVTLEFWRGNVFNWRIRLTDGEKQTLISDGAAGIETKVPWWIPSGEYTVIPTIDSYRIKGALCDDFEVINDGEYTFPTVKVDDHNGAPAIYVDGKPFPWCGTATYAYSPGVVCEFGEAGSNTYVIAAAAGTHNYPINVYPTLIAQGENDFSQLEERVSFTLQANENAHILLRINFGLPVFWLNEHMDSAVLGTGDGVNYVYDEESTGYQNISLTSADWLNEEKIQLEKLLEFVASKPWSSRVIGVMLTGGVTEEWFAFFHNTPGMWGDYSEVNRDAFAKWAEQSELLKDFAPGSISIPLPSQRINEGYSIKPDTADAKLAAAYTGFINHVGLQVINELAKTVKDFSGSRLLCGSLYGYLVQFASATSPTQSGVLDLESYLSSPYLDYLCGIPHIDFRDPVSGYDVGISATRSIQAAGMTYIQENDEYMWLFDDRNYPTMNPVDDGTKGGSDMLTSTFAYDMVYGNPRHYFGLFASWHHSPILKDLFTRFNAIQTEQMNADRTPADQIAFMIDDTSYEWSEESSVYLYSAVKEMQKAAGRSGCSVGTWLLSDIDKLPDTVKAVIVSVGYAPDAVTIVKLKKAIAGGDRTIICVGPLGLIDPVTGRCNYTSTSEITGLPVKVEYQNSLSKQQIKNVLGKTASSKAVEVNPVCTLAGTEELSSSRNLSGGGRLIWLAVPLTDPSAWWDIAESAGIKPTAPLNCYVHASKELVSVTSGKTGELKLCFDSNVKIIDLLTGWEGKGSEIPCGFYAGQSRLFRIEG